MSKLSPACFLFLFAPVTAEYLSGSSPFLNPIVLLVNMVLYGCGILLIRELKVRWQTGWLAVFVLSIAYTIAEEGFMLNTLFDPEKNTVGRFIGVNWVWTTGMIVVHSLISVLTPILIAETVYAAKSAEQWIKPKTFWIILAVFLADVFGMGHLLVRKDRPGWIYYAIEFGIIAACILVARLLPHKNAQSTISRSPRWFYFAFLLGTVAVLAMGFAAPSFQVPTLVKIALMLGVYSAFLIFVYRNQAFNLALTPISKLACASGIISFWILLSPLMTIAKGSAGPLFVAVLMILFLLSVRKRLLA